MSKFEFSYDNIEQAIENHGEVAMSITGCSMYPMLRNHKDTVVIEKVNRPLKKLDVPLYRMPSGKLILHRIIKVKDGKYVIRGDNMLEKEYNVTDDMIIGVLKEFYRNGKRYVCADSKKYRLYIALNRATFPFRFSYRRTRGFFGKIKRKILK